MRRRRRKFFCHQFFMFPKRAPKKKFDEIELLFRDFSVGGGALFECHYISEHHRQTDAREGGIRREDCSCVYTPGKRRKKKL